MQNCEWSTYQYSLLEAHARESVFLFFRFLVFANTQIFFLLTKSVIIAGECYETKLARKKMKEFDLQ